MEGISALYRFLVYNTYLSTTEVLKYGLRNDRRLQPLGCSDQYPPKHDTLREYKCPEKVQFIKLRILGNIFKGFH
jgi:hypothetical protein